jgi:hypothetical protein
VEAHLPPHASAAWEHNKRRKGEVGPSAPTPLSFFSKIAPHYK